MTIQKECLVVKSGDKVNVSGYYIYFRHCDPDEFDNCFITNKAKIGLYITKGSIMPSSGSCNHQIEWRLDQ